MRTKSISTTCGLLVFALSVGACSQKGVSSSPKATNPASEVSATLETEASTQTESIEVVITDQLRESADEARAKRASLAKDYSRRFNVMEDQTNKIELGINFWAVAGTAVATGVLAEKAERISQVLARASDSFAATMRRMPDDFQERMDKLNKLAREASEAQTAFNQFKAQVTDGQIQELRRLERAAQNAVSAFKSADKALLMRVTRRIEHIGNGVADVFNKRASRLRSMEGAAKVQRIIVTGGSILVVAGVGKIIYDIGFDEDSVVIHAKVIEELKKDNPGYESVIDTLELK